MNKNLQKTRTDLHLHEAKNNKQWDELTDRLAVLEVQRINDKRFYERLSRLFFSVTIFALASDLVFLPLVKTKFFSFSIHAGIGLYQVIGVGLSFFAGVVCLVRAYMLRVTY